MLRDERLRYDVARQCAGWPTARVLVVDADGRVPIEWTGRAPEGPWGMDTDGTARLVTMPTTGDSPPDGRRAARRGGRHRVLGRPRAG